MISEGLKRLYKLMLLNPYGYYQKYIIEQADGTIVIAFYGRLTRDVIHIRLHPNDQWLKE